jgi:hypothetical protein
MQVNELAPLEACVADEAQAGETAIFQVML